MSFLLRQAEILLLRQAEILLLTTTIFRSDLTSTGPPQNSLELSRYRRTEKEKLYILLEIENIFKHVTETQCSDGVV
jgi:hypothetical protein